ncbi:hypothetical protein V7O61_06560 [Methanolobus sp. WCC1]|uniref:hypothetical protein n=1 Tax=unclassified Methanolobus TaxID=2629569 RepID=UPI003243C209
MTRTRRSFTIEDDLLPLIDVERGCLSRSELVNRALVQYLGTDVEQGMEAQPAQ